MKNYSLTFLVPLVLLVSNVSIGQQIDNSILSQLSPAEIEKAKNKPKKTSKALLEVKLVILMSVIM